MRRIIKKVFVIAILACVAYSVLGAEYTIKECIDIAVSNNKALRQSNDKLSEAKERLKQAKGTLLPTASVGGSARYGSSTNDEIVAGISADLSYDFFDGGLRGISIKTAQIGVTQAEENYRRSLQTLIFNVASAYVGVIKADAVLGVSEEKIRYNEEQIEMVKARIEVGDAPQADLYPMRATLANSNVDLLTAKNGSRTARIALFTHLGMGNIDDFEVLPLGEVGDVTVLEKKVLYDLALKNRSDVRLADLSIETAKLSLKSTEVSQSPMPTITGKVSQPLYSYNSGGGSSYKTSYEISVGASWSFFTGGSNEAKVKEKEIGLDSLATAKEEILDTLSYDLDKNYLDIAYAFEKINAAREGVIAARTNFDAQNEMYKNGLATAMDLQNASITLASSENNLITAKNDFWLSYLAIYYTAGLIDDNLNNDTLIREYDGE